MHFAQGARRIDEDDVVLGVAHRRRHPGLPHRASVHQRPVGDSHLQRGDGEGSLSGGDVHHVTTSPATLGAHHPVLSLLMELKPLPVGDEAGLFEGEIDTGATSQAEVGGPLLQKILRPQHTAVLPDLQSQ